MKRVAMLLIAMFAAVVPLSAQSVAVGDRAPELKPRQWLGAEAEQGRRTMLVEFFSPSNPVCMSRLAVLDSLASVYGRVLRVVLVTREDISGQVDLQKVHYSVALDPDYRIFKTYGIQFVPCGVIVDERGRVAWVGNTSSVNATTVKKWINDGPDKDRALRK